MFVVSHQYDLLYERSRLVDTIRQYVLSVICIVICCGVLQLAVPKGTVGTLFRVISGLAVTITVLSPLLNGKMLYWN